MDTQSKHGVENIKKAHTIMANLAEGTFIIIKDGTNVAEMASVGSTLILKSMGNIPSLSEIPKEYADMDDKEREEVNAHFAKELDLPNDGIELIMEKSQKAINALLDLGFSIVSARKKTA